LESARNDVCALAAQETALTIAELEPEFGRAVGTLRMFAGLVRAGSTLADIHSPPEAAPIGPNHPLRRILVPIGPVAVFGASNFPLAYGVLGGDTASALAAGCAAIVKEHPAHPELGRRLAQIAREACAGVAEDAVQYLEAPDVHDHTLAASLVTHPALAGVGFTGSVAGGIALAELARTRPVPIPVFAEQGSLNPVAVLPAALGGQAREIAHSLAGSILLRHGQQCTKPGLILLAEGQGADELTRALAEALRAGPARRPLAPWIGSAYLGRLRACEATARFIVGREQPTDGTTRPALLEASSASDLFLSGSESRGYPTLLEETFGPAAVVVCVDATRLPEMLAALPGALTGTVWASAEEQRGELFGRVFGALVSRAGRVIINGVPTGVRVSPAMTHTGPWPASNHPEASAVGPAAVLRWLRPVTVQGTINGDRG
jgi:NADP-dependent aldehyde dehydrogenase